MDRLVAFTCSLGGVSVRLFSKLFMFSEFEKTHATCQMQFTLTELMAGDTVFTRTVLSFNTFPHTDSDNETFLFLPQLFRFYSITIISFMEMFNNFTKKMFKSSAADLWETIHCTMPKEIDLNST